MRDEVSKEFEMLFDCGQQVLLKNSVSNETSKCNNFDGIEWDRVKNLAQRHRMESLLLNYLSKLPIDNRPKKICRDLRDRTRRLQLKNLSLIAELTDIIKNIENADIPILAYKGPVVASRVYDDATVRAYDDLDILVPKSKMDRATSILDELGYEERAVNRTAYQAIYFNPKKEVTVDIHTRIIPEFFPFQMPFEDLYSHRMVVDIGGKQVPTLATEDAFLLQTIHGAKHHWYLLERILSTAVLATKLSNPQRLLMRAKKIGCERMVLLALELSRKIFDNSFGPMIEKRLKEQSKSMAIVRSAANDVVSRIVNKEWDDMETKRSYFADFRLRSQLMSNPTTKLKFWVRMLTMPRPEDVEWIDLPESLTSLYRVIRPFRLAIEYWNTIWNKDGN